jgi:hypothetical protein
MQVGQDVRLRVYGGKEVVRRIVGLNKHSVIICRIEESEKALLEKRQPKSVGFPIRYILEEQTK